jgi:hypothetical protein
MKRILTSLSVLFICCTAAQIPQLSWGMQMAYTAGTQTEGSLVRCDGYGNVYALGIFDGDIDADPTADTRVFTSVGENDLYIAKYRLDRDLLWAVQVGGHGELTVWDIEVEPEGDFVIVGYVDGDFDFDPGAAVNSISSEDGYDGFVAKYNSSGELMWVFSIGVDAQFSGASVNGVDIDANGFICVTGEVKAGSFDLNPSANGSSVVTGNYTAFFLARYKPNGEHVFSFGYSGSSTLSSGGDLEITSEGYIIVFGQLIGSANVDPLGFGTMRSCTDRFLAKYSIDGDLMWFKEIPFTAHDVFYDENREVIGVEGELRDTVDVDDGPGVLSLPCVWGNFKVCIAAYSADGEFRNAFAFAESERLVTAEVAMDADGNFLVAGDFADSVDVDPGPGVKMLHSVWLTDIFVCSYTAQGELRWGFDLGEPNRFDDSYDVCVYGDYFFITGEFSPVIDLDPGPPVANLNSPGLGGDALFAKYFQTSSVDEEVTITVLPNPTSGQVSVQGAAGKEYSCIVYDMLGNKVLESGPFEYQLWLDMRGLADGVYVVDVYTSAGRVETAKVIVAK